MRNAKQYALAENGRFMCFNNLQQMMRAILLIGLVPAEGSRSGQWIGQFDFVYINGLLMGVLGC